MGVEAVPKSIAGRGGESGCSTRYSIVFVELEIQNQNSTQFLLHCSVQDCGKTSLLFTESHEDGDEISLYPTLGSHKTMGLLLTIAKVVSVTRLFSEKKSIIHGRAGSSNLCGSQTFVLHKTHLQS